MARKKKAPLTKKQLDILYDCWKEGTNTKERLVLIEERMPKVPTLTALKIMRRMAKTDSKWLRWATRQKNLKEKEKLEKQKERERKKKEREQRRKEREQRKEERRKKQLHKNEREYISKNIDPSLSKELEDHIPTEFFFCPAIHQYVTNISCIFRIFGEDFSFGSSCDKCKRMDKYIPILKEFIDGRSSKNTKRQRPKRNTASKGRSKTKTKKSASAKTKTATRKASGSGRTATSRRATRKP
jgi:hypothetical protein